jgi:hypothetical protein
MKYLYLYGKKNAATGLVHRDVRSRLVGLNGQSIRIEYLYLPC